MASVATRKKSVALNNGLPQIDIPVAANTILNKASTTSLYQRCTLLLTRLSLVYDFAPYLSLASGPGAARKSTDPMHQLWDVLALGIPLCFLYNLLPLPSSSRIEINTDPDDLDLDNLKDMKKAIAQFIMRVTALQKAGEWDQGEIFSITELVGSQRNTNGFVKVVDTVETLLNRLPTHVFMAEVPPSPPSNHPSGVSSMDGGFDSAIPSSSGVAAVGSAHDIERAQVIRELVDTERKYVADLEAMQVYANTLRKDNIMDSDTIHHLFPGLNALLDFQRQFLISVEGIAELPWPQQRWGHCFFSKEDAFQVYEPYCANYTNASELLVAEEQNLAVLNSMINCRSELPAFLIKPVQRICKYPLLLESLVKRSSEKDYPYYDELLEGLAAAKRCTDKVNEAQRRAENMLTVKALGQRVEDWKGHHLTNFGALLLDELFIVNKADVDREYHVFLFEKIILCCKDAGVPVATNGRKGGKNNSILKKTPSGVPPSFPPTANKKKTSPLLLKGRIFLNNVTSATPSRKDGLHALQVWWRGDDDLEYFTLRCRTEEQLKQWENTINKLIKESAARRQSERGGHYHHERTISTGSNLTTTTLPPYPGPPVPVTPYTRSHRQGSTASSSHLSTSNGVTFPNNRSGVSPGKHSSRDEGFEEGWEEDTTADEQERSRYYPSSGRATPSARPPSRPGNSDAQYASLPRPPISRGLSSMSAASEASFGNGVRPSYRLQSKFSSTRLRNAYEQSDEDARRPSSRGPATARNQSTYSTQQTQPPPLVQRTRSASTPTAYNPNNQAVPPPPPLPVDRDGWSSTKTSLTIKRESGDSTNSTDSSDYSNGQMASPITPYGSTDSGLATSTIRAAKSQVFGSQRDREHSAPFSPPVKIKVHFGEDLFVIVVPRSTEYDDLVEKVGRKIRLCGGRRQDDGPLRVKYQDEDGDMISLGSDEDVQMAFDTSGRGQVTLFVV